MPFPISRRDFLEQYYERALKNPETEVSDFLEFADICRAMRLCMMPGCTTCGCGAYRSIVQQIGEKEMLGLLAKTTPERLLSVPYRNWYDPLRVAVVALPSLEKSDSFIMRKYLERQEDYYRRRAFKEAQLELQQMEAEKRRQEERAKREEKYRLQKVKQKENSEQRNELLKPFWDSDLSGKLSIIASDQEHHPNYYGLDFARITVTELQSVPIEVREKVLNRLSNYPGKDIQKFIRKIIKSKE